MTFTPLTDLYASIAEARRANPRPGPVAPMVMGDKGAYKSPMDRTVVDGRTAHKEHMRKHGVQEAGDIRFGESTREKAPEGIRDDINRAVQELNR